MSSSPTPLKRAIEEVLQMQLSRGRQAVPGADEAYTYGSGTTAPGGSRPQRYVVDAVDADEAIDGCSEPRLWRLQLNITRHGFVGGCGTSRGGEATCCTPSTRAEALWKIQVPGGARLLSDARRGEHLVRGIISRTSDERSGSQTNGAGIIVVSREF